MVEEHLEQGRLLNRIHRLTEQEKKVLELRFGLGDNIRRTQLEIARLLGISRSYVSRIEKRALNKLIKDLNGSD